MNRRIPPAVLLWCLLGAAAIILAAGCGDKIAIPKAVGLYGVSSYVGVKEYADDDPRQLVVAKGALFVVTTDALTKRDLGYGVSARAGGLDDPRAVCVDSLAEVVFAWEQGAGRLSWYDFELTPLGSEILPDVTRVVAMAASPRDIWQVPGARTFLYLSDPDAGVIHRYAFDDFNGPSPYGILARSGGAAARFVHQASGLTRDGAGMLLVCDADTLRNWVIRFDGAPDLDDTTPDPTDQDPWRGLATTLCGATCEPPAAADYVIGDAATCGQTDWVGGPSDAEGEFTSPSATATDGSGRIFVADTGNDRIQIFDRCGQYDFRFGGPLATPRPVALGVVDVKYDAGAEDIFYGAEVFVLAPSAAHQVLRFQSYEYYVWSNREPPPPPE